MDYLIDGFREAFEIIFSFDRDFISIVFVSLRLALTSTFLAALAAVPAGVYIAHNNFRGRQSLIVVIDTLMSLPTVVIGLVGYAFLSRIGPFGQLRLLYTLSAVIIGQFILSFPILCGLTISAVGGLDKKVVLTSISLGANKSQSFAILLYEARFGIFAAVIAGFARVFSEVGVSMMLGGNIKGYTRTITTAIALETSKGEFALGIALGIVLLAAAFLVNMIFHILRKGNQKPLCIS